MVHAGTSAEFPKITTDAGEAGIRLIRRMAIINLALVALQPVSAGLVLSGYGRRAVIAHALVAFALQFAAFIQASAAVVLWRRHRIPRWLATAAIGLLVMVALEVWLGYSRWYWLHVPVGVGMFGGLLRQVTGAALRAPAYVASRDS
jgi:hypothetical protein